MNIVILYSELMNYTQGVLESICVLNSEINIYAVFWDKNKLASYRLVSDHKKITYIPKSEFETKNLTEFLLEINPSIVYVSGWMDNVYLKGICDLKKERKTIVIAGIDDQWRGRFKQFLLMFVMRLYLKKRYFDYLWIAGKPQYHYARLIGFKKKEILSDLLSAHKTITARTAEFSKRLVYLGRLSPEKGSLSLVNSYTSLPEVIKSKIPLVLIGDGPEMNEIKQIKDNNIIIKGYLQGNELVEELLLGGISIAPSLREQWGVMIHEMASMGYPLLLSDECGAATEFLIEGYNGFLFDPRNSESIKKAIIKMNDLDEETLRKFGERSKILSQRINSEISAASFLSVLYK